MQQQQTIPAPGVPIVVMASLEERCAKCAWCWDKNHPGVSYPREWSSTVCPECDAAVSAEAIRVKAARAIARKGEVHVSCH
jgi:hypothetical protein